MLLSASEPLPEVVLRRRSLLRGPATPHELAAAELRLAVALPPSYRAFLLVSDGAYADWDLIGADEARSGSSEPHIGLLPVADVDPTVSAVPMDWEAVFDSWSGPDFEEPPHVRRNLECVVDISPLRASLLITSLTWERGKYFLSLVPVDPDVDVSGERYELWDKGHAEFTRYLSFGDWLEASLTDCWYDPGDGFRRANTGISAEIVARAQDWPTPLFAGQVRRLTATRRTPDLLDYLDHLWRWPDPYVRLASAQVLARHAPDVGLSRLAELTHSADPTVALVADKSIVVLGGGAEP